MTLLRRKSQQPNGIRVAFNMKPVTTPWGGGNQWLLQLIKHFEGCGYGVQFDLDGDVDCIVATNPLIRGNTVFAAEQIAEIKQRRPEVRFLNMIGDNDLHRGSDYMDVAVEGLNGLADYTVFCSQWLLDYHAERWFDRAKPHEVLHHGADPAIYHPFGNRRWTGTEPLRLVTHHWSDNPLKGFPVYEQVDRLIAAGELTDTELWVIGRWPADLEWRAARTFPAASGHKLAALLRQAHVYLTASLWEPGGLHYVEGAQCGLPLLYHEDGGGIVEVGRRFGIGYRDDVAAAIAEMRTRYGELRAKALEDVPYGDRMSARYRQLVQGLVVGSGHA